MSATLPTLSPAELTRYSRHLLLNEVGLEGQRKLAAARVLVVGAGGLGSPAALYLAAAGIGTLGIADFDRVAAHNLPRQLLHEDDSVGEAKVVSAARRLHTTNPFINVVTHPEGITPQNATRIFENYDVIVDGTDNFSSRYLNNDAAFQTRKPLIYGSLFKFEGQVTVFDPNHGAPCYRCLFPAPPPAGSVPGCGEAGILGVVCGVIGSLQAVEAIKLVLGIGEPLRGRLLVYDSLTPSFQTLILRRDPQCPLCGEHPSVPAFDSSAPQSPTGVAVTPATMIERYPLEMSVTDAKRQIDASPQTTVLIDVREPYELEICRIEGATPIPMRQIPEQLVALPKDKHLLILCHRGGRSRRVTEYLRTQHFEAVSNVSGGIDAWAEEIDPDMRRY